MEISKPERLNTEEYRQMLQQCIHCGLCLQACPTYSVFGTETDSPRGRISLIRAASEGRIELDGALQTHINLCLACRSCETACPSGVRYGSLVEEARIVIEENRKPGRVERWVRWLALYQLMPHIGRLKIIARLARLYQIMGIEKLVQGLGFLPERIKLLTGLLPKMPVHYSDYRQPAPPIGTKRGTVAFFHGCVQEAFLAEINQATVRVLQRNGYKVHFPRPQTCCGAAHLHLGEEEQARSLARKNIDVFFGTNGGSERYLAIINNAGGCGATLKEYPHLLRDDPQYAQKAVEFAGRVKDISEFLAEHLNVRPGGEIKARATYSDSCHLRHAQKVVRQPRDLLRIIPGLELVELKKPERCCGSAGVYNIIQTESANAILAEKMQDIAEAQPDLIVTTNTGCYFQIQHGARQAGMKARVVHLVELLDESYRRG